MAFLSGHIKSHENRPVTPAKAGVHKLPLPLWIPAPDRSRGQALRGNDDLGHWMGLFS